MTDRLSFHRMPGLAVLALALWIAPPTWAAEDAAGRAEPLLPPAALAKPLAPTAHPLAKTISQFLVCQQRLQDFKPTDWKREDYLKVIAGQVRVMRGYQNAEGRIIDPVAKAEAYYATPCYAHAVAALAARGFDTDPDWLESGMKAMDLSTADMVRGTTAGGHGDFFVYPLMLAYSLYAKIAPPERLA